jgi:hypothetical protein
MTLLYNSLWINSIRPHNFELKERASNTGNKWSLTSFITSYFDGRNGKISANYQSYHQSFLNFLTEKKLYKTPSYVFSRAK